MNVPQIVRGRWLCPLGEMPYNILVTMHSHRHNNTQTFEPTWPANPAINEEMLFLSQLIGQTILDKQNEKIASIKDVIVRIGTQTYPPVSGLVARASGRDFFISISQIQSLDERGAKLATYSVNLQPFARRDGEVLLGKDVLDKQLVDLNGRRVIRVNDLQLARADGEYFLAGVDVGAQALLRRLAPIALFIKMPGHQIIDWADVEYFASDAPAVRLKVSHDRLAKLHPVELARIVESLPYAQGTEIVESLDDQTVADALEEMTEARQADFLEAMEGDRAADVLEKMAPDEAADLIGALPEDKAEQILELMEAEESAEVKQLLSYPEDDAGGVMTTEFVAVPQQFTAQETIDYIRAMEPKPDVIYYVYAFESRDDNRLVGVTSLLDVILAPPKTRIADIMNREPLTAKPDESDEDIARTIAEYNLLALPIVDEANHILGIVTVDDALDIVLPESWRQRLPKIFS